MKPWTAAAFTVGTVLYVAAISNEVYAATSPPALSWHVLLRKTYSVLAFALVGYLIGRAVKEHGGRASTPGLVLAVAIYSLAIEIGQDLSGSHEGLLWNAVDVLTGALGGVLGALVLRRVTPRRVREQPPH